MPTWSDKLLGEVVRLLLEAYDGGGSPPGPTVPARPGLPHSIG